MKLRQGQPGSPQIPQWWSVSETITLVPPAAGGLVMYAGDHGEIQSAGLA